MQSKKMSKKKVTLLTVMSVLLSAVLVLSGVGIYLKLTNKEKSPAIVNPLDFSVDAWDGKTVDGLNFNESYAGRKSNTKTINSAASFMHFINEVNNGNSFEDYTIYLNKNIDLNNQTISPIGTREHPFKGIFDGGHYTILNANIDGDGLFGNTENATIKNVGLYNSNTNLIHKAINTNVENAFVRLGSGLLVDEYISNNGTHEIKNSFVDSKANGLIGKLDTNNSSENQVAITNCYFTNGETAIVETVGETFTTEDNVIKATNKSDFNDWSYSVEYSSEKDWCGYDYLENSQKLDFVYPIQSGFAKVFLTGSCYESVMVAGDTVIDTSNLATAFVEADKVAEAEVNLLVEKIFMEAQAEVSNAEVKVNAVKDTTIVRGENNTESMFVGKGDAKLTIGNETQVGVASGSNEQPTLTIDGNKELVEKNNLESGAVVVAYGGEVEIKENVIIKDNVNNSDVAYGGGVLLYNTDTMADIKATFENCQAEYGGAVAVIGTTINSVGSCYNCSAEKAGGALYLAMELPSEETEAVRTMYGEGLKVQPTDTLDPNGRNTVAAGTVLGEEYNDVIFKHVAVYDYNDMSTGYGGAIYCEGDLTISGSPTFTQCSAYWGGGAIYMGNVASSLTISGNPTFSSNTSNCGSGGAIYLKADNKELKITGNPTFTSNTLSMGSGAAIYVKGASAKIDIIGSPIFTSNKVTDMSRNGGAIYLEGASSSMNISGDATFANNSSGSKGGTIYVGGTASSIEITGDVILNDTTSSNAGANGQIYCDGDITIKKGLTFKSCSAGSDMHGDGGAIYCGGNLVLEGDFIFESNMGNRGGAIYSAGTTTIKGDCTFDGNQSMYQGTTISGYGGASIYSVGDLTLEGKMEFKNTEYSYFTLSGTVKGGVIYSGGKTTMKGEMSFTDTSIKLNTGWGDLFAYGGALYSVGDVEIAGTITFDNNDVIADKNYKESAGGAIYTEGSLTIVGTSTFSNNSLPIIGYNNAPGASKGGAIYCGGELAITGNATFEGNTASDGGAIYCSGDLTISGGATFNSNSAIIYWGDNGIDGGKGGAIYCEGDLTITGNPTFQSNGPTYETCNGEQSGEGGAIYCTGDTTISGNPAFISNVVWNTHGGAIYSTGDITISGDAIFRYNQASAPGMPFSELNGGAIYATAVTISGKLEFSGNSAYGGGGAIYASTVALNQGADVSFTSNSSYSLHAAYGGAIAADVTINDGANAIFKFNSAGFDYSYGESDLDGDGGAIYGGCIVNADGSVHFESNSASCGGAICGGTTILGKATFKSNSATENGGAIYCDGELVIAGNATFEGNAAYGNGGAIKCTNMSISGNATFKNNSAIDRYFNPNAEYASTSTYGGAIYSEGNLTISGTALFDSNTAYGNGGAIYCAGNLTISGKANFLRNINVSNGGMGGGAIRSNGVLNITDGAIANFYDNVSKSQGGAIVCDTFHFFEGSKVAFERNETTGCGGAIFNYNAGGSTIAGEATFKSNQGGGGGALYLCYSLEISGEARFEFNKAINTGNYVGGGGGAIHNHDSLVISGKATFISNSAVGGSNACGGAILVSAELVLSDDVTFESNSATGSGGAIYYQYGYNYESPELSSKVKFTSNSAGGSGGAIYFEVADGYSDLLVISGDAEFISNTSKVKGGAVYSSNGLSISGSPIFKNNSVTEEGRDGGGACMAEGNLEISGNPVFDGNSSTFFGGAAYSYGGITISGAPTFVNNKAQNGGALLSAGYVEITGGATFEKNEATNAGGAIGSNANVKISVISVPAEYQRVEYIESSGTQYINTGFVPNQDTRVVCDFQLVEVTAAFILGSRSSVTSNAFTFNVSQNCFSSIYNNSGNHTYMGANLDRHIVEKDKNKVYFDEWGEIDDHGYATFTCPGPLNLFAAYNGTANGYLPSKMKLYSCQVYDNGALVRDFIPCYRISDNVAGLYDNVSGEFYENAGNGSFAVGKNVGSSNNCVTFVNNTAGSGAGAIQAGSISMSGPVKFINNFDKTKTGLQYEMSIVALSMHLGKGFEVLSDSNPNWAQIYLEDYQYIKVMSPIDSKIYVYKQGAAAYNAENTASYIFEDLTGGRLDNEAGNKLFHALNDGFVVDYNNLKANFGVLKAGPSKVLIETPRYVEVGEHIVTKTITLKSPVAGTYSITSRDESIAKVLSAGVSASAVDQVSTKATEFTVSANQEIDVVVQVVGKGETELDVEFTPTDSSTYAVTNEVITVNVLPTYTITFITNVDGDAYGTVSAQTITAVQGDKITMNEAGALIIGEDANVVATPTTNTPQYKYEFVGWTGLTDTVEYDMLIMANFKRTLNKYTINIEADATMGSLNKTSVTVDYGTSVAFNQNKLTLGTTPVTEIVATPKDKTNQYTYSFVSWEGKIEIVEGATTIKAIFTKELSEHKISIVARPEEYGSVDITSVDAIYGQTIAVNGNVLTIGNVAITATPKVADAQYTYTFKEWTGTVGTVEGTITIYADFTRTVVDYSISYELNGGTVATANPTTYNCETETFTLNNPTKVGYTFAGWTGSNGSTPQTTVTITKGSTGNRTYTANWTANPDTAYKVYHYKEKIGIEDPDINVEEHWLEPEVEELTGTTDSKVTPALKEYTGFTAISTAQEITIMGDGSVEVKYYYSRNQYAVTINQGSGFFTWWAAQSDYSYNGPFDYGDYVTLNADVHEACTWSHWEVVSGTVPEDFDGTKQKANFTMPASDLEFTCNATINEYTVTWVDWDGTVLKTQTVTWYDTQGGLFYDGETPTREANAQYTYTFSGWDPDPSQIRGVTRDMTFTAQYSATVNTYTITFVSSPEGYGTTSESKIENLPYNSIVTIDGGPSGTVSYLKVISSANWELIADIRQTPTTSDAQYTYEFTGWTLDDNIVDCELKGHATIIANFTRNVNKYKISIVENDKTWGKVSLSEITVDYGTAISASGTTLTIGTDPVTTITATPTTSDAQYTYGFADWSNATGTVTGIRIITANFTRTLNSYTITVNVNQDGWGTVSQSKVELVPYGTEISNNGSTLTIGTDPATTITATPTTSGAQYTYGFKDWTNGSGTLKGNVTITANFTRDLNKYTVTFDPNGGDDLGDQATRVIPYGSTYGTLPVPNRKGYTFAGWFMKDSDVEIKADTVMTLGYDHTLFAKWNVDNYSITYDLGGGTVTPENPRTYTVEDEFTLNNPTHSKFTFLGWKGTGIDGIQKTVKVEKGSTGPRSYTAVWQATVTVNVSGKTAGNTYGITSTTGSTTEGPHTSSFAVTVGEVYSFVLSANLTSDAKNNAYQILKVDLGTDNKVDAFSPVTTSVNSTLYNSTVVDNMTITIRYLSAYMMKVNVPENSIAGLSVNLIDRGDYVIKSYASANAYIIADNTPVTFTLDSTPVSQTSKYTFIGYTFTANGTEYTVGVNGGNGIQFINFDHNDSYTDYPDIGTYSYAVADEMKISSIVVNTIVTKIVPINTAAIPAGVRITLESVHGLNKVIDSSTPSVVLYSGEWSISDCPVGIDTLKQIFAYNIENRDGVYVVIVT